MSQFLSPLHISGKLDIVLVGNTRLTRLEAEEIMQEGLRTIVEHMGEESRAHAVLNNCTFKVKRTKLSTRQKEDDRLTRPEA